MPAVPGCMQPGPQQHWSLLLRNARPPVADSASAQCGGLGKPPHLQFLPRTINMVVFSMQFTAETTERPFHYHLPLHACQHNVRGNESTIVYVLLALRPAATRATSHSSLLVSSSRRPLVSRVVENSNSEPSDHAYRKPKLKA